MPKQVENPYADLATAVVFRAMVDANEDIQGARWWFGTPAAEFWLDCVGLDVDFIQDWLRKGCPMATTNILATVREGVKDDAPQNYIKMAKLPRKSTKNQKGVFQGSRAPA